MFSRRHPYLFFLLVLSGICASVMVSVSVVVLLGLRSVGLDVFSEKVAGRIGVVEVSGYLMDSIDTVSAIRQFREDDSIQAIILRVDSPGGAVGPAQEIYREIIKTIEFKPVVASLGTTAASGGYYIASGATQIVANPGTITGSIGVIMSYANFEELIRKFGLVPVIIKSGEHKDMGSPMRKMLPEERAILQGLSDQIHRQFIQAVAEGRKLSEKDIRKLADGRIFSGETAHEKGLVDILGNFEDAVLVAASLGNITGKPELVHSEDRKIRWIKKLTEAAAAAVLGAERTPMLRY
ncbi:MAG: signal peptide peptidase SppA [Thermodesulfobacteriota bacterium]